jgi:DNA-directed RNA polymerase subunit F
MVRKILEEKPIPLGQVFKLLQIREEAGINYVQRVTAQHAEKLSRNAAYTEEIIKTLQSEFNIPRIQVVQLVNLNPKTSVDVQAVTGNGLSDEQIEKLLEHYSEFVTKIQASAEDSGKIKDSEAQDEDEELEEGFEDL